MAYQIRKSEERGISAHGWLNSFHTFSFGNYYDPKFMGFRDLRVINEDTVQPGGGFPSHSHENMEILSFILKGNLSHKDSLGTTSTLYANHFQLMSAGSRVTHSEFNSSEEVVHFLQIWIHPNVQNVSPHYQEAALPVKTHEWILIASPSGEEKSLIIRQDVKIFAALIPQGEHIEKYLPASRYGWLQILAGELQLEEDQLKAGDGVAFSPETQIKLLAMQETKILFFDLC